MGQSRTYRCGTPILLLLIFILAVLACVSVPISQAFSLFTLEVRQADTRIRAGLWGFCVPDETVSGLQCSKPRVAWTIKSSLNSDLCPSSPDQAAEAHICTGAIGDLGNLVSPALTGSLLIHVFATVLAFITFLMASVFALRPDLHQSIRDRLMQHRNKSNERLLQRVAVLLLPLLFTFQLAAQLTIAVVLDIVVVSIVKRNAAKKTANLTTSYGSVTWITLVAALFAWFVLLIQLSEGLRSQSSRDRTSMRRADSFELRPRSFRNLSSLSSPPQSVRSSSVTTPSGPDDDPDYLSDHSRSNAKENLLPWLCCISRGKNEKLSGSDDVSATPSTPPQHRRFSWESHGDNESYVSSGSDPTGSALTCERQRDQRTEPPIFACLPCLKRKNSEPEDPEEIELQDIVVSRDDSSSVYSQSAASVEDFRDSSSSTANIQKHSPRDDDKHDSKGSHLTWGNVRKALKEIFTSDGKEKEKTKELPGDTQSANENNNEVNSEEPGDRREKAEEQDPREDADPSPADKEDEIENENENETPEKERAFEPKQGERAFNDEAGDDVPSAGDESAISPSLGDDASREILDEGEPVHEEGDEHEALEESEAPENGGADEEHEADTDLEGVLDAEPRSGSDGVAAEGDAADDEDSEDTPEGGELAKEVGDDSEESPPEPNSGLESSEDSEPTPEEEVSEEVPQPDENSSEDGPEEAGDTAQSDADGTPVDDGNRELEEPAQVEQEDADDSESRLDETENTDEVGEDAVAEQDPGEEHQSDVEAELENDSQEPDEENIDEPAPESETKEVEEAATPELSLEDASGNLEPVSDLNDEPFEESQDEPEEISDQATEEPGGEEDDEDPSESKDLDDAPKPEPEPELESSSIDAEEEPDDGLTEGDKGEPVETAKQDAEAAEGSGGGDSEVGDEDAELKVEDGVGEDYEKDVDPEEQAAEEERLESDLETSPDEREGHLDQVEEGDENEVEQESTGNDDDDDGPTRSEKITTEESPESVEDEEPDFDDESGHGESEDLNDSKSVTEDEEVDRKGRTEPSRADEADLEDDEVEQSEDGYGNREEDVQSEVEVEDTSETDDTEETGPGPEEEPVGTEGQDNAGQNESDDQELAGSSKDTTDPQTEHESVNTPEDEKEPDSSKDVHTPGHTREKVRIDCTEVDEEERPDRTVVKRHKSLQMLEDVPGKPLVCTACGAYIYVRRSRIEM